jgi:SET domain-containing protein
VSCLHSKVYVGKSRIHGNGLFARRLIGKGEQIGRFEGNETDQDGRYVLWIEQDDCRYRGIEGTTELRFVNHSRLPNAEFVKDVLVALRPIQPGDEITCHYGESWGELKEA